jgi:hypothetical protein
MDSLDHQRVSSKHELRLIGGASDKDTDSEIHANLQDSN